MKRVFLVMKEDLVFFPPVLSLLNILPTIGYKVIHIGVYSDEISKKLYESKGIIFMPTNKYHGDSNLIKKFLDQYVFKTKVNKILNNANLTDDDLVWILQSETVCLLHNLVGKYKSILHFFENVEPQMNWKYRLMSVRYNPENTMKKAHKIVCCEYNRAQIIKGLFQLESLPIVFPNKLVADESCLINPPSTIKEIVNKLSLKVKNKKVILYQGIFLDKERRLEEFCEAINHLPDEYVLIAMGGGSNLYEELKEKYESDRILFIPFINPPYHLLVTKMADIGILSYFPRKGSYSHTLNPLYCAPNKIFEYAKYSIPMISNDVPALKYIYMEYGCGECVTYPVTAEKISKKIVMIFNNIDKYKENAMNYYNSVDIKNVVNEILS